MSNPQQNYRMVFYLLLESASRYRESFWRDDLKHYRQNKLEQLAADKNITKTHEYEKIKKKILSIAGSLEVREQKFNSMMYGKVAELESGLTPEMKIAFDEQATAYGLLVEELLKAENTTELLTVARLYNEGYFKEILAVMNEPEKVAEPEAEMDSPLKIVD